MILLADSAGPYLGLRCPQRPENPILHGAAYKSSHCPDTFTKVFQNDIK